MGSLILVGGGMRSGKSRFALELAESLGKRRTFLATARVTDQEMLERIRRHQLERAHRYTTVECPVELADAISIAVDVEVIVIDCFTFWMANLLEQDLDNTAILARIDGIVTAVARNPATTIIVSNEVGMGLVSMSDVGRRFQDLVGWGHQRLSAAAAEIYLAVMGVILRVRPAPVVLVERAQGTR